MIENPALSKNARQLTVRIKSLEIEGSGIIYMPQNNAEKLYILTAKHCICGEKFQIKNPKVEDIEIEYYNEKEENYNTYHLSKDDKLLYFDENEKDITLLIINRTPFEEAISRLPSFQLIDDEKGVRNSVLFGFPEGSHDNDLERVDTVLQLPTRDFIWKAETQRTFQSEICIPTLGSTKGFSGSGLLLNIHDEYLLFGIVTDFIEWNRFKGVKVSRINDLLEKHNYPIEPFREIETNEYTNPNLLKYNGYKITEVESIHIQKEFKITEDISEYPNPYDGVALDLITSLEENINIVLLGGAGSGKSNELKYFHNLLLDDGYFPFYIDLKNKQQDLSAAVLPSYINPKKVICLFDGLDEVNDIGTVIQQINHFKTNHRNLKFIVSCRTNIYADSFSFKKVYIQKLSSEAINAYLLTQLKTNTAVSAFNSKIFQKDLYALTRIPFFLIRLCKLYLEDNRHDLPNNKKELFEKLTENALKWRLKDDTKRREKKRIRKQAKHDLKKLAFVMECTGLNQIDNDTFHEYIVNNKTVDLLLRQSSLISGNDKVQKFSHRNFQEFFASQVLAEIKDFDTLLEIILVPETKDIKLTWLNTIGFLWSNLDKSSKLRKQLYEWLIEHNPITFTKFEKDFIDESEVLPILKAILKFQKKEGLYFSREQVDIYNLTSLCYSLEAQQFLMNELKNTKDKLYKSNVFSIIQIIPDTNHLHLKIKNELKDFLVKAIFDENNRHYFISKCIEFLGLHYKNLSLPLITKIVETHFLTDDTYVRWKTIAFIGTTNTQHLFIDKLFSRLSKDNQYGFSNRLGNESSEITDVLENIDTDVGLITFLQHFPNHFKYFPGTTEAKILLKLLKKIEKIISSQKSLDTIYQNIFQNLVGKPYHLRFEYRKPIADFLKYANKELQVVQDVISNFSNDKSKANAFRNLGTILNPKIMSFIVEETTNKEISEEELTYIQQGIISYESQINFNQKVNRIEYINLILPKPYDHNAYINKDKRKRQTAREILFNKKKFIDAIAYFFQDLGKDDVADNEIFVHRDNPNTGYDYRKHPLFICHHIKYYLKNTPKVSKSHIVKDLNENWDTISMYEICSFFRSHQLEFNTIETQYVKNWCDTYLKSVNNNIDTKHNASHLAFLIQSCKFSHFNKKVYKLLVRYNYLNYDFLIDNYIVEYEEIEQWLMKNLKDASALFSELKLIEKYEIHKTKIVLEELLRDEHQESPMLLRTYIQLGNIDTQLLFDLIQKENANQQVFDLCFRELVRNTNYHIDLKQVSLNRLEKSTNQDIQLNVAKKLTELGEVKGLEFIVKYITEHKKSSFDLYNLQFAPAKIENLHLVKYALQLFELGFDQTFNDERKQSEIKNGGIEIIKYIALYNNGEFYSKVTRNLNQKIKQYQFQYFFKRSKVLEDMILNLKFYLRNIKEIYSRQHTIQITNAIKTFDKIVAKG